MVSCKRLLHCPLRLLHILRSEQFVFQTTQQKTPQQKTEQSKTPQNKPKAAATPKRQVLAGGILSEEIHSGTGDVAKRGKMVCQWDLNRSIISQFIYHAIASHIIIISEICLHLLGWWFQSCTDRAQHVFYIGWCYKGLKREAQTFLKVIFNEVAICAYQCLRN